MPQCLRTVAANRIGERTEEIAVFCAGALAHQSGGLDPSHRLESRPLRFGVEPIDRGTQGIAPNLDPARIFLDRFPFRPPLASHFGVEPPLDIRR